MTMKFYMAPGSCSTGIHIILEKLDLLFEAHIVNIPKGQNRSLEYLALNPKGTIPTLVLDDGQALTEYQSIAYYLASAYPKAGLLPTEPVMASKTLEIMAYVVNTLHGQGFARIFATDNFIQGDIEPALIQEAGYKIVRDGFEILNTELNNISASPGDFTLADASLFYVEFWAGKLNIELPANLARHYDRMLSDPVVSRVLREEGYY